MGGDQVSGFIGRGLEVGPSGAGRHAGTGPVTAPRLSGVGGVSGASQVVPPALKPSSLSPDPLNPGGDARSSRTRGSPPAPSLTPIQPRIACRLMVYGSFFILLFMIYSL